MSSVNKAIIIGRLGKDPELRATGDGKRIANFSVATSESWRGKDGTKQERTEWHNIVIFNENLAKLADEYLKKGSQVYLEGALRTRKWEDKDGRDRYTTEIVLGAFDGVMRFLGKPAGSSDDSGSEPRESAKPKAQAKPKTEQELDDEVPF
jgi:single-strand DNA-binding protein